MFRFFFTSFLLQHTSCILSFHNISPTHIHMYTHFFHPIDFPSFFFKVLILWVHTAQDTPSSFYIIRNVVFHNFLLELLLILLLLVFCFSISVVRDHYVFFFSFSTLLFIVLFVFHAMPNAHSFDWTLTKNLYK